MITVEHLTKRYGDYVALDDVSFTSKPGRVTGFLGPNGAGKSTTMRIIAGLTPATAGTATVGGVVYRDIPNPSTQVGVLLDASAQHAGRTGAEILHLSAMTLGVSRARVEQMLAMVSLTRRRPSAACATTHSACASAWVSRTRCWVTRGS